MESEEILETDGNQAADKDDDSDKENINAVARPDVNRADNHENLDAGCGINRAQNIDTLAEATPGSCVEAGNKLPNGFGFTPNTTQYRTCHEAPQSLIANNAGTDATDNKPSEIKNEDPIDTDVLIVTKVLQKPLDKVPPSVPDGYKNISPSKLPPEPKLILCIPIWQKKPDEETAVLIPHDNADGPCGDEFGAKLCTYKEQRKDGTFFYRHFLVEVDPNGPACQMKISDCDEIVLLNEVLAPELTHKELLDKFCAVKVDGRTRFTLVIRRVENKKWRWIETSAILSPDKVIEDRPHVKELIYKPLEHEEIEVKKCKCLYKVPGTQEYLDICDGKVSIGILKGDSSDKTKIIWRRVKYWQADDKTGTIDFAAALCDLSERWYIAVNKQDQIVVDDKPIWFMMIQRGSKTRFQYNDVYLGYDRKTGEVKAEVSQCVFEELPADGITNFHEMVRKPEQEAGDKLGAKFDSTSEIGSELSSSGDHTKRRNTGSSNSDSDRRSIGSSVSKTDSEGRGAASSQISVDSDRGSILSSEVSVDDLGEEGICDNKTSDISLSQSSGTSGYRSENSTEDIDCSPVKDTILNVFESSSDNKGSAVI